MTVYMRWLPDMRDTVGSPTATGRPKVGSIGVSVQTDTYGQHLIDFNIPDSPIDYSRRYWCRPQDLQLVKERDFLIQQAMEALGAQADEKA